MIEDENDPHLLLRTLVSFGVVVTPVDDRHDLYTARCPFARHPEIVDTLAPHREHLAADPERAAHADEHMPGWRDRERPRPAFQIAPRHGVFCCYGCGVHGGLPELAGGLAATMGRSA